MFQAAGVSHRVGWRSLGGWYFIGFQKQKLGSCGYGEWEVREKVAVIVL